MGLSREELDAMLNSPPDPVRTARGMREYERITGRPFGGNLPSDEPEHGTGRRESHYIRVRTDEILYRAGLLSRSQCHRDADITATPDAELLARDMLSLAGGAMPERGTHEFYRAAMTTSDLPLLLENIGAKALQLGYDFAPETWPLWTRTTTTKDFKPFGRPAALTIPTPPQVRENGAIPAANLLGDTREQSAVQSFAETLDVSRETLINDDLQAFAQAANAAGRAVSRLIGNLAVAVLVDNGLLSDGVALFASGHGNDATTGAAPSVTTLDELRGLMAAQTGPGGEALNLRPYIILGPPNMEGTLAVLRSSMNAPDPDDASTGRIVTVTDSRLTGAAWYGLADPRLHGGVEIVVLEGTENRPRFERKQGRIQTDTVRFTVGYDCIALVTDYRAVARNSGA